MSIMGGANIGENMKFKLRINLIQTIKSKNLSWNIVDKMLIPWRITTVASNYDKL